MNTIKTMALAANMLLMLQFSFATDRIVEEGGAGGSYTTISAALLAAASGDRILVYPKGGGNSYDENLNVTKANIKILSAVSGQRFLVVGDVNFSSTAAGAVLTNAVINGGITCMGTNITIAECKVQSYLMAHTGVANQTVYLSNDTLKDVQMVKGRVSGCVIIDNQGIALNCNNPGTTSTDTLVIVGNTIYAEWKGISVSAANQFVVIANNYVQMQPMYVPDDAMGISVFYSKSSTTVRNICNNNSVAQFAGNHALRTGLYFNDDNFDIENNVVKTQGNVGTEFGSGVSQITFRYNYSNAPHLNPPYDVYNGTNLTNSTNATSFVVPSNGVLLSYSPAIDGGSPATKHLDTDLSRNDAGCFGGSYNIANFRTAAPEARVLFMNAPRTVLVNTPFRINADGLAK